MAEYNLYWGDTHHNSYQHYRQDPPLAEVLAACRAHLDFYTGAYYTPAYVQAPVLPPYRGRAAGQQGGHLSEQQAAAEWAGVHLEGWKDPDAMAREWAEFQAATAAEQRGKARDLRAKLRELQAWLEEEADNRHLPAVDRSRAHL